MNLEKLFINKKHQILTHFGLFKYFLNVKKGFLLFIVCIISLGTNSQVHQGEWRDHLSYTKGFYIAASENFVYCASESGLLSYNKTTGEIKKHSKVTGLSDVEVSTLAYSPLYKIMLVGYKNGSIDLIKNDATIINISDIKRKNITGTKTINRIITDNQYAYLACDFGIVVIDLAREEIKDSYLFGNGGVSIKINDLTIINGFIYAATESGIYSASLSSPNLVDYTFWTQIGFLPQSNSSYKFVEGFNNKVFAVYSDQTTQNDKLIIINSNSFENSTLVHDDNILDLSTSNGFLTISGMNHNYIYNQQEALFKDFGTFDNFHTFVDVDQKIYVATYYYGFNLINSGYSWTSLAVNCPRFSKVSKISTFNDVVWVSSGGPDNPFQGEAGAYSFINNQWKSYNVHYEITDLIGNIYKTAIDPTDNSHVYASAYRYGLIEFQNNQYQKIFTAENTSIFGNIPSAVGIRIDGLNFDQQNNLWMVLDLVSQPLLKLKNDRVSWERPKFSNSLFNSTSTQFSDFLITKSGQFWFCTKFAEVLVLEENASGGFTEEPSFIIKNDGGDVKTRAYCLDEDTQGNIWIGTNSGPVIYNPSNLFANSNIVGQQYRVPRNDGTNNADFFLAGEAILDIATDGGNRKWLATEKSGVYLVSDDGKKVITNFRETNSPLLSNNVSGVGINEKSGEVFFTTSLGIISYQGIATEGNSEFTDVYVYPNPVRPDYEGNITITGLIENTIVKITDVSGNLVFETKSLGGQASWDGRNFNRRRVSTGVYIVFLSTEDGLKTYVTKLVFIH